MICAKQISFDASTASVITLDEEYNEEAAWYQALVSTHEWPITKKPLLEIKKQRSI